MNKVLKKIHIPVKNDKRQTYLAAFVIIESVNNNDKVFKA
jgi:hypothetical protein